jgi:chorismate-pyruvate lyase
MAPTASGYHRRPGTHDSLFPLDVLYARASAEPPSADTIESSEIPLPYRDLLVHTATMTSTLEHYYGGTLEVRLLAASFHEPWYWRHVLLAQGEYGKPVEMGAMCLQLNAFRESVRQRIVAGKVPLGRIIREAELDCESRPIMFFRVTPNKDMIAIFRISELQRLYGRRTELFLARRKIGDVVEILSPIVEAGS